MAFRQYSDTIAAACNTLDSFLGTSGHPHPSTSVDSPITFPDPAPAEVKDARATLIEAARSLYELALWPQEAARATLERSIQVNACMRVLVESKIFDAVPQEPGQTVDVEDLVKQCGIDNTADQLARIIYRTSLVGVLAISESGRVSHTATSALFAKGNKLYYEAQWFPNIVMPSAAALAPALRDHSHQVPHKANTAFNKAFGVEVSKMEWIDQSSERTHVFGSMMQSYGTQPVGDILAVYDWASFGDALLVDVGGNDGYVASAIAGVAPDLRFIVQDQSGPVTSGLSLLPATLKDRVTFMEHDFFTQNPVHQPDIFLLRCVLHDWPDAEAVEIIRGVSDQMGLQTQLMVMDFVYERRTDLPAHEMVPAADLDIVLMIGYNGRERGLAQWKNLFQQADPTLLLVETHRLPGGGLSLMEWAKQSA